MTDHSKIVNVAYDDTIHRGHLFYLSLNQVDDEEIRNEWISRYALTFDNYKYR